MYSSEQTERIHLVKALDPILFGSNTLLMLVASQLRKQILQRATLASCGSFEFCPGADDTWPL